MTFGILSRSPSRSPNSSQKALTETHAEDVATSPHPEPLTSRAGTASGERQWHPARGRALSRGQGWGRGWGWADGRQRCTAAELAGVTAPSAAPEMTQVPPCQALPPGQRFVPASGCATPRSPRDRSVPKHLLTGSQKHPPAKFLDKINHENVTTAWGSHQTAPGGEEGWPCPDPCHTCILLLLLN